MTDKVEVRLLFFAKARDIVGKHADQVTLTRRSHTMETLLDEIINRFEGLHPISKSLLLAVNEECIAASQSIYLKDGDEIAIMPPFSGG